MKIKNVDGNLLAEAFSGGVNYLILNKEEVNALNVFPVPDGDTGTNMSLTAKSSLKQINNLDNKDSVSEVAKAAARGSLMGARGNSGVILSQFLRGFSEGLEDKQSATIDDLAHAFKSASDTTYKAVMKPTEGTILTVGREVADFAVRKSRTYKDITEFFEDLVKEANLSLSKTPEKLQVLKEAGVVDAGGKGLTLIFEGILKTLKGEKTTVIEDDDVLKTKAQKEVFTGTGDENIKFGYCTEFIISTDYEDVESFKSRLSPLGDCLLVVGAGGTGLIKVHIHTNNPGEVLEKALKIGALQDIKIDNMRFQHKEVLFKKEEVDRVSKEEGETASEDIQRENSFIVVSIGDGINKVFKSLGADYIVEGGQTMNPSTEDFINAIDEVKGKKVFIIPNNSNIILAANQARDLTDREVYVVPTKSIPQGVTALLSFSEDLEGKENLENMTEAMEEVVSAQVTYAVRNTNMNGKDIKEGDIIGLSGKEIISSGDDVNDVTKNLISKLVREDTSMITIYWGFDLSEDKAQKLCSDLREEYGDLDIDLIKGDQPLYYYLISLE
ncbi:DAK2 domain-containing protein [Peptoniphilus catoniae]|uniref:DAK2 domain-containing protein n=1 Tax=Peptoniphilus catoniae TaxID=1660341 RepID=UPI0010FEF8CD|nr:DAK2 domain-containing protein [Peptoniphilus catoniae]